ncbi:hypothetical protein [cf. Phormidesmis sp. LEGE 11477]|uniref:hypothetical protein n=1 Tax=cf. Phormidesmis sp. LEGE 11477 TaxID=1828680 RepID=UPI0018824A89|nr:hypothetical protein [cf. Phormidesmis sp. LEGE 11477]MBE9064142.1 hypothetical protein [cf. Phormidesmis sp. LEGE 11477]
MQITLSSQQSKALESLAQHGGYALEDAIDTALVLLADEITQQNGADSPGYLSWLEQTRTQIEVGVKAVEQGAVVEADEVLTRLRNKVEAAKAASA